MGEEEQITESTSPTTSTPDPVGSGGEAAVLQKPVKKRTRKNPASLIAMVRAKDFSKNKRSILRTDTPHQPEKKLKANTLLVRPPPLYEELGHWRALHEFDKLAAAAEPLERIATARGWDLRTFTLILTEALSDRIDGGDESALEYIRDQMTRLVSNAIGPGAEFLYGVEKAPAVLSDPSSRRRWHLHGLMIGPPGFSAQGPTSLRKNLRSLKGEADADLMFKSPGRDSDSDIRQSAARWCFYASKNGLSVHYDPSLAEEYDLPKGKQTFISARLKREAKRWHEGKLSGLKVSELLATAPAGLYEPNGIA
ncbi:hypothetical protein [Pseudomonas sp. NBRC 111120]|uniref:hypothetical protein n=1 Tax=Pseudomonas sp. NBRC 111120 TaxID=1661035 RepID=UPI00114CAC09|nr:hypothetical protein [Pseudomonas sp. NBRC 111120]